MRRVQANGWYANSKVVKNKSSETPGAGSIEALAVPPHERQIPPPPQFSVKHQLSFLFAGRQQMRRQRGARACSAWRRMIVL